MSRLFVIPEPADEPSADTHLADTCCEYCGHPISYGQPAVEDEHGLWHRSCWLDVHESKPIDFGTSAAEWYPCPEAVQWAARS